jgi:hypothetical protein
MTTKPSNARLARAFNDSGVFAPFIVIGENARRSKVAADLGTPKYRARVIRNRKIYTRKGRV